MSHIYVSCKECTAPFVTTTQIDLAALEEDDGRTHVMMCPFCLAVRPYVSDDALILED